MTVPERLLTAINVSGPLDDDELAQRLHVARQHINQAARRLERDGRLRRYVGPQGKIVNAITSSTPPSAAHHPQTCPTFRARVDWRCSGPAPRHVREDQGAHPAAAKDLYISPLFRKQRAYAEALGVPWYILSAEHGLVAPDEWLAPYERYLPDTSQGYRRAWGEWVVARLELLAGDLGSRRVEVHASKEYVDAIRSPVEGPRCRHRRAARRSDSWPTSQLVRRSALADSAD